MNCQEETSPLGYLDGELDAIRALEFEEHMKECSSCSVRYETYRKMSQALREPDVFFKAPDHLEALIRSRISPASPTPLPNVVRKPAWWITVAALAALILITVFLIRAGQRPSSTELLAQQVVDSHVRSLMASHLMDVPSSDQHTVKPWFAGKLDFAPVVKDFAAQGFPLVGGRLDYLDGRPVAALLYKRHQHIINLFLWPSEKGNAEPKTLLIRGFNLVFWVKDNMDFWAISDLNPSELNQFAQDQRK